jgi:hypothetical protein
VLRQNLAAYIARMRGIDAAPDRLVITGGTTQSMRLLSHAAPMTPDHRSRPVLRCRQRAGSQSWSGRTTGWSRH